MTPALSTPQFVTRTPRTDSLGATLALWLRRHHGRRALARLDAHQAQDVGLSPARIAAECAKPFWRA